MIIKLVFETFKVFRKSKKDDFVNTTLIGIIGGSTATGGIAIIIAWKKELFTKGRN